MPVDLSYLTQGIENEKIINLTFQGDIKRFGNVGDEYKLEDAPIETRSIRDTTASKYLVKGSDGYAISQGTIIDSKKWAGVYTYNNGNFPFVLRDYKYMVLRAGQTNNPTVMLLELFPTNTWEVYSTQEFDNDGHLIDFQDNSIKLISTTDVITDYEGNESEYLNENICQWVIVYKIKKVLRLHNPVQLEDSATD